MTDVKHFDLNVEKVLDGWSVAHAVRELIANALDEHVLSGSAPPTVTRIADGVWQVRDFGRGLRYEHLTQNESVEKRERPTQLIGRFGVGLKDALAVLHRRDVGVHISSRHGTITLEQRSKAGFEDVITLHAIVAPPADASMIGTAVRITDVTDDVMERAMGFFLVFSGERVQEQTRFGAILARRDGLPARIYVNGLVVAEEDNFAFSYNITSLTEQMRRALNRERTNVGRTAYSQRVKEILLAAESESIALVLARDLERLSAGTNKDETSWLDVQLRACQVLSARGNVVLVTAREHVEQRAMIDYAKADGRTVITVPDGLSTRLPGLRDARGAPVQSLSVFGQAWSSKFEYSFVEYDALSPSERVVFDLRHILIATADVRSGTITDIRVSETIQPAPQGGDDAWGVWLPATRTIVLRRDLLRSPERFARTLMHEVAHAKSGADDVSLAFESELSDLLGRLGAALARIHPAGVRAAERLAEVYQANSESVAVASYLDSVDPDGGDSVSRAVTTMPVETTADPIPPDAGTSPTVCDNRHGLVVAPACVSGVAQLRVRVSRVGEPANNYDPKRVCHACAANLERWALERFFRFQRGRLRRGE